MWGRLRWVAPTVITLSAFPGIGDAHGVVALEEACVGSVFDRAKVSGSCHHNDTVVHDPLTFVADRSPTAGVVGDIVFDGKAEVGTVDHDVVVVSIEIADELESCDDAELGTLSVVIQNPEVVQLEVRTDTLERGSILTVGLFPITGEDSGNVGAMGVLRLVVVGLAVFNLEERLEENPVDVPAGLEASLETVEKILDPGPLRLPDVRDLFP